MANAKACSRAHSSARNALTVVAGSGTWPASAPRRQMSGPRAPTATKDQLARRFLGSYDPSVYTSAASRCSGLQGGSSRSQVRRAEGSSPRARRTRSGSGIECAEKASAAMSPFTPQAAPASGGGTARASASVGLSVVGWAASSCGAGRARRPNGVGMRACLSFAEVCRREVPEAVSADPRRSCGRGFSSMTCSLAVSGGNTALFPRRTGKGKPANGKLGGTLTCRKCGEG